ncbi:expressed unknown protein [Seminavis robusta]|uniref:Uncharacterized protein n=1 Tax=Seminavis robusta TaxID=568900 RepID=A0A9N8EJZ8_9STRA|nr:expressed unknown protein [Seminavis robusta]|eukprot:Sro1083_g239400.1 n/a (495) ;mRNA; r:24954-26534
MATEARRRRTKQQSLPIIHFYEEFVKTTSTRNGTKALADHDTGLATRDVLARRRRSRAMSTDATDGRGRSSPDILTTESITITNGPISGPVSPLTPNKPRSRRPTRIPSLQKTSAKGTQSQTGKTPPTKRLTLYERSQLGLKEREKKIKSIRDELMKECTFKPNTANTIKQKAGGKKKMKRSPQQSTRSGDKSSSTTPTTASTHTTTTTSTRQYWQDFQRSHQQQPTSDASSKDGSKTSLTTKSLRFEELYKEGLRKARQRPATEKAEQELRNKRLEEEQMRECTFKPKLYWGKKIPTTRRKPLVNITQSQNNDNLQRRGPTAPRSLSPRRKLIFETPPEQKKSSICPKSPPVQAPVKGNSLLDVGFRPIPVGGANSLDDEGSCSIGSLSLLRRHHDIMRERRADDVCSPVPPLPLEIITTGVAPMSPPPWSTVLYSSRRDDNSPMEFRRTLGIEVDAEDGEKSPLGPRVIFCGTTVGGDSIAAQTQRTEYGSI